MQNITEMNLKKLSIDDWRETAFNVRINQPAATTPAFVRRRANCAPNLFATQSTPWRAHSVPWIGRGRKSALLKAA